MNFIRATIILKSGRCVARKCWSLDKWIYVNSDKSKSKDIMLCGGMKWTLSIDDLMAKDWVVALEPALNER